jgi:small subunit ribosomal protein S19e
MRWARLALPAQSSSLQVPTWADHVKTGITQELAPYDPDWFYYRTGTPLRCQRACLGLRVCGGTARHASSASGLPPRVREACFCFLRAASIARKVYLRNGVGIGALRTIYGGRKSRGTRPHHHGEGSGAIARACLKQLEKLGVVEK